MAPVKNIVEYKEIWSIPMERLTAYFENTYQASFSDGSMTIEGVNVVIIPLSPNTVMKIPIPRCQVEIAGSPPEAEEIHRRFVMNFLSAGG